MRTMYDKRFLVQGLIALVLMVAVMNLTAGFGIVAIIPVVFFAIGKNRVDLLLYCLLTISVFAMTNEIVVPRNEVFSIATRIIYLIVGVVMIPHVIARRNPHIQEALLSIFPYLAYMAVVSSIGWQPSISYLKLLLFTLVFLAFYGVSKITSVHTQIRPERLRGIFLCFACFLIIGSLIIVPFPDIGLLGTVRFNELGLQLESTGLFMGVLNQPQALGPAIATVSVILFADLLFSLRRVDKLYMVLLLASPCLIFYTSSRTAMGTYLLGMFFVGFLFMTSRGIGSRWKNRVVCALLVAGLAAGAVLLAIPQIRTEAITFISKQRGTIDSTEAVVNALSSREGLFDSSMANFYNSPLIGNGFQVSETMEGMNIVSWKQLLSAPIEKGVWVPAVLEEGGVIGMFFFILFLVVTFGYLWGRRAVISISALFVLLISNFGEFTIFSMSGLGGLLWSLVFVGLAMDSQRISPEPILLPKRGGGVRMPPPSCGANTSSRRLR